MPKETVAACERVSFSLAGLSLALMRNRSAATSRPVVLGVVAGGESIDFGTLAGVHGGGARAAVLADVAEAVVVGVGLDVGVVGQLQRADRAPGSL